MLVFKFGGASVNSVDRIKNVGAILQQYPGQKILVVISAMGKTTNALEKVVEAFMQERIVKPYNYLNRSNNNISQRPIIYWLQMHWPVNSN